MFERLGRPVLVTDWVNNLQEISVSFEGCGQADLLIVSQTNHGPDFHDPDIATLNQWHPLGDGRISRDHNG